MGTLPFAQNKNYKTRGQGTLTLLQNNKKHRTQEQE